MEGELGVAARIAIALIVIGVIISVIFVILGFTRAITNQGISTVQNSMDAMSQSQFDDYDQQILSGTQVKSAVKLMEGRPIGIIIQTAASTKKGVGATGEPNGTAFNFGAFMQPDPVSKYCPKETTFKAGAVDTSVYVLPVADGAKIGWSGKVYNPVDFTVPAGKRLFDEGACRVPAIELAPGESYFTLGYRSTPVTYNLSTSIINETGNDAYVRPTAKFMANLAKDSTGTIVAIVFIQLK